MYKPSEEALRKGLDERAGIRDQYFQQLMGASVSVIREIARANGLDTPSEESHYSLACRIVEFEYPEIDLPGAGSTGLFSTTGESTSYHVAEPIRSSDVARYADMIDRPKPKKQDQLFVQGGFLHGPDWMLDGPAFVGYRGADGTVQTLDIEGVVMLSGLRPNATEQSSVVLVSVSNFFDGDYIKDFVTRLYAVLTGAATNRADLAYEIVSEMMSHEGEIFTQDVVAAGSSPEVVNEANWSPSARAGGEDLDATQLIEKITRD